MPAPQFQRNVSNYWEEELGVLSSENVHFSISTAGLGSRLVAISIDMAIQLILLLVSAIFITKYINLLADTFGNSQWIDSLISAAVIIYFFLLFYGYFFFFEWLWHGMTPGKRIAGLRVLQINGMPATFWQILVRNVLRIADFLPAFYGAGTICVILNNQNQRIGDQVAGTIVARERQEKTASQILSVTEAADAFLAEKNTVPPANPSPESIGLRAHISHQDYEIVCDFLLRRETLPPATRIKLARMLTYRLANALKEPAPPEEQFESFLEYVARHYQE